MERINARQFESSPLEHTRCGVCGAPIRAYDSCCEPHELSGLTPEQYVDLFWDEA
jgi:hypothetical protein